MIKFWKQTYIKKRFYVSLLIQIHIEPTFLVFILHLINLLIINLKKSIIYFAHIRMFLLFLPMDFL